MLSDEHGTIIRVASRALSLASVAAGRLNGFAEHHMNAWDCLAGQLLVHEAGGMIEAQNANEMLVDGGRVVVAAPVIFEKMVEMADKAFG
jgi:myo-inositol-1(or 4)-monophosphatase